MGKKLLNNSQKRGSIKSMGFNPRSAALFVVCKPLFKIILRERVIVNHLALLDWLGSLDWLALDWLYWL